MTYALALRLSSYCMGALGNWQSTQKCYKGTQPCPAPLKRFFLALQISRVVPLLNSDNNEHFQFY